MLLRNGVFMEFKRIDDTKFQCLLDEDDLEDNNISLDDFFRNDTLLLDNFCGKMYLDEGNFI